MELRLGQAAALLQYYTVILIEENTVPFVIQEMALPVGTLEIDK